jgi:signal recognition particle subunit SRP54
MGDVLTLIEKAQANFDEQQAKLMQRKLQKGDFDLEDFLQQLQQVKKMGPIQNIMEMIPGFSQMTRQLPKEALDDRQLKRIEAIISSMTLQERHNPTIIDGSRRRRIARGSGVPPHEVNQLLNQFRQTQKMMKQLSLGKGIPGLGRFLR